MTGDMTRGPATTIDLVTMIDEGMITDGMTIEEMTTDEMIIVEMTVEMIIGETIAGMTPGEMTDVKTAVLGIRVETGVLRDDGKKGETARRTVKIEMGISGMHTVLWYCVT
jgi:hypothetical protein